MQTAEECIAGCRSYTDIGAPCRFVTWGGSDHKRCIYKNGMTSVHGCRYKYNDEFTNVTACNDEGYCCHADEDRTCNPETDFCSLNLHTAGNSPARYSCTGESAIPTVSPTVFPTPSPSRSKLTVPTPPPTVSRSGDAECNSTDSYKKCSATDACFFDYMLGKEGKCRFKRCTDFDCDKTGCLAFGGCQYTDGHMACHGEGEPVACKSFTASEDCTAAIDRCQFVGYQCFDVDAVVPCWSFVDDCPTPRCDDSSGYCSDAEDPTLMPSNSSTAPADTTDHPAAQGGQQHKGEHDATQADLATQRSKTTTALIKPCHERRPRNGRIQ